MKEKIHTGNYEAYLLDYQEGRLTEKEEKELFLFLKAHPELGEVPEDDVPVQLMPPDVVYGKKEILLKPDLSFESIDEGNIEEAMIAFHEGTLSAAQRERLEEYLQSHHEKRRDHALYGKVYLRPPVVTLKIKQDLYKRERKLIPWLPAAAAGIALLLAVSFLLRQNGNLSPAGKTAGVKDTQVVSPAERGEPKTTLPAGKMMTEKKDGNDRITRSFAAAATRKMGPSSSVQSGHKKPHQALGVSASSVEVREVLTAVRLVRNAPLPVYVETNALMKMKPVRAEDNIDLLAERTGKRIRKNLLSFSDKDADTPKPNAKELFFNSLARLNQATGLNINYEKMEEPDKGREYLAVTSRYFTFIRKKKENK